ncbi:hypothetical protein Tco_1327366 [Tanacetum coccineum]
MPNQATIQKDKTHAVISRLIYVRGDPGLRHEGREESHYSESKTPTARTESRRRHGDWEEKDSCYFRRYDSLVARRSPQAKKTEVEQETYQQRQTPSRTTIQYSESEDSEGGHWKSRSRRQKSNTYEDDLYQPWTCEERNPFTLRIRHFCLPRTRMPSHVKTYDGSGDPEDHPKVYYKAAAKIRRLGDATGVTWTKLSSAKQSTSKIVDIHHIKQRDRELRRIHGRYKAEKSGCRGCSGMA